MAFGESKSNLIRGVAGVAFGESNLAFGESNLIRGVAFGKRGGLW